MRTTPFNLEETPLCVLVPMMAGAVSVICTVWLCVGVEFSLDPAFVEKVRIALNATYITSCLVALIGGAVGGFLGLLGLERWLNRAIVVDMKVVGE